MTQAEKVSAVCAECAGPLSFDSDVAQVSCSFCESTMAVAEDTQLVRLACPACGGSFCYLDGQLAGRCPYCETALAGLTRHLLLRYAIRPQTVAPVADAEPLWVPIWRVKGLIYGWDIVSRASLEIDYGPPTAESSNAVSDSYSGTRMVDSGPQKQFFSRVAQQWLLDPAAGPFGVSALGWRPALYPLEVLSAEHERWGRVLAPVMELDEARGRLRQRAFDLGNAAEGLNRLELQRRELVAETISLLYYPFWVQPESAGALGVAETPLNVWDAVTGEPESLIAPSPAPGPASTTAFDELVLIELRCGHCGEALGLGSRAVVYPCHRCGTFWIGTEGGLKPFTAAYAEPQVETEGGPLLWLPFWRVGCEVGFCGQQARSVAGLGGVLNVHWRSAGPQPPRAGGESPLSYFVPAYGAYRAPRLDPAARDMTRIQPPLKDGGYREGAAFSAFFAPEDAMALGHVVFLHLLLGTPRRLASLRVRAEAPSLWYVAFEQRGRELVSTLTGARYERAIFRGIGH